MDVSKTNDFRYNDSPEFNIESLSFDISTNVKHLKLHVSFGRGSTRDVNDGDASVFVLYFTNSSKTFGKHRN